MFSAESRLRGETEPTVRPGKPVLFGCTFPQGGSGWRESEPCPKHGELYPDREDLRDMRESLPGGWLVATNLSTEQCAQNNDHPPGSEVAGLKFGKDVIVDL